jgi:RNA polymerase sigma-70 factor (ECF subfamily)
LLALFLLQHSRRETRRDAHGNLVSLDKQDRTRWDHAAIAEAVEILSGLDHTGPYVLQARIAACHATATTPEDTDWRRIARCYDDLVRLQPSPVIALNRAVAHGFAYGPAVGLALLAQARTGGGLGDYPWAVAAEAELTARDGDRQRAAALFREAAARVPGESERRALLERAGELET